MSHLPGGSSSGSFPGSLPGSPRSLLAPGSWLGLLGGGQLGRMFCMAAQSLGYRVCVLDPGAEGPAASVADRHLQADYLDEAALARLADWCPAVTTEFENVPARALEQLAARVSVSPSAQAVAIAQDRIAEKAFIRDQGIEVAPYRPILSETDLEACEDALFPAILKVARLGYDGKGQARVADRVQARAAFVGWGGVACVLEKRLQLASEISVVVARGFDGQMQRFPVAQNEHRGGILAVTRVPAQIPESRARAATEATARIAEALDYVGVLCVEYFVLADGRLLANEMAPRPHNSGHYTIDACVTSQFEQQARILARAPLGSVELLRPAVMINLLGDCWYAGAGGEPDWAGAVLSHPRARLHLYGKTEARPGRKMGHVTVLGDTLEEALGTAAQIERDLGIPAS